MEEFDPSNPHKVPWVQISDYGTATFSRDTSFSWGDPRYQSPETWSRLRMVMEKGRAPRSLYKVGAKADVWSMGATLFELLSGGKIPFLYQHASLKDVLDNKELWTKLRDGIAEEEIEIRKYCPNVSFEVEELLELMLKKEPDERPTAAEVLNHRWFSMRRRT